MSSFSPHAREKSNETLVPPKPKELLITASKSPLTFCGRIRRSRFRRRRPSKPTTNKQNVCGVTHEGTRRKDNARRQNSTGTRGGSQREILCAQGEKRFTISQRHECSVSEINIKGNNLRGAGATTPADKSKHAGREQGRGRQAMKATKAARRRRDHIYSKRQ